MTHPLSAAEILAEIAAVEAKKDRAHAAVDAEYEPRLMELRDSLRLHTITNA